MAMTAAQKQDAYKFFIVSFGAITGVEYMNQINDAYNAGLTTKEIVNIYSTKPQFEAIYPRFLSNEQFADKLIENVVGASATAAAKTQAKADVVAAINAGWSKGDVVFQIFTNLSNKAAGDADWGKTAAMLNNKVKVAEYYTETLLVNSLDLGALGSPLQSVTNDAASVEAAKGNGSLNNGQTFTLTNKLDALTGTAGNDVFVGTLETTTGASTINVGDSVDGGAGTDTFKLMSNVTAGNNNSGLTLTNVEKVEISNLVNGTANVHTFNAATATGVQEIAVTSAGDVTVTNIGTAALAARGFVSNNAAAQLVTAVGANTLNLGGVSVGTAAGSALNIDVSGGAAGKAQAVVVNSTGAANTISNLKIGNTTDGASSLTINAATNFKTTVTELAANKLETITASGAATTVDVGTIASTALKSVDASGLTAGGMKIGIGDNLATTFKGGAGSDTVTIKAGAVITGAIDGGAGTDIIAVSDTFAGGSTAQNDTSLTTATGKLITGFETLRVSATSSGGTVGTTDIVTFDPTLVAGITSYEVGTSTYGVALKNLVANAAVKVVGNVSAAGGLTLLQKDATGTADAATLTFDNGNTLTTGNNNGLTVAKLTVGNGTDSIETLNVVSKGLITGSGTANTITTLNTAAGTAPSKVVITGDQAFSLTTGTTAAALSIDGSAATGALTISSTTTAGKVNVNGGSANDSITLGAATAAGSLIYGGKGGDAITITSATNAETLVYKAATDSLIDVSADATKTTMDTITGFGTNDIVDLSTFGFTANQKGAIVYATAAAGVAKVLDAANAGAATWYNDASATARAVKLVSDGTDGYLFVDANKDGQFNASSDLVIKLVGVDLASEFALANVAF